MDSEASNSSHSLHRPDSSEGSVDTAVGVTDEDFNALVVSFYTRAYPSAEAFADDAADFELHEIKEAVTELANEVSALREETYVLSTHVQTLQQRRPGGGGTAVAGGTAANTLYGASAAAGTAGSRSPRDTPEPGVGPGTASSPVDATVALLGGDYALGGGGGGGTRAAGAGGSATVGNSAGTTRRGRSYRRRSLADVDVFMRVDDKAALLRQETTRLRGQEEKAAKEAEGVHEVLAATVEEAVRRQQELRLEVLQFEREVLRDATLESADDAAAAGGHGSASRRNPFQEAKELTVSAAAAATTADELLRYLEYRHSTQVNNLDKLEVQCQAVEQDIARAQQLVRQRRIAGEAFQAVDLEQLRIEHKQFSERMEAKNNELAELKGTSTRTVQQLNHLMGQLNELASEQTRLKREAKSRSEYLSRCGKEIATATTEAAQAETKHLALKAQQEAVKVPKIEEYMAQKAEEVELEKAVKNWERKVQIAEGQASVVRSQCRRLQSQRTAVLKYASERRHSRGAPAAAASAPARPMVGGARSLLEQRRQQGEELQVGQSPAHKQPAPSPPQQRASSIQVLTPLVKQQQQQQQPSTPPAPTSPAGDGEDAPASAAAAAAPAVAAAAADQPEAQAAPSAGAEAPVAAAAVAESPSM